LNLSQFQAELPMLSSSISLHFDYIHELFPCLDVDIFEMIGSRFEPVNSCLKNFYTYQSVLYEYIHYQFVDQECLKCIHVIHRD